MRLALGLALFLLVAGLVYVVTSHEYRGSVLLLVCAAAIAYVGLVVRGAVRRAGSPEHPPVQAIVPEEEAHVGPTIWPFVFSIAALLLVVGILAPHWILIPGGILFIGAGAGWFTDIKRQWSADHLLAGAGGNGSALQHQQPGDQGHRDQH